MGISSNEGWLEIPSTVPLRYKLNICEVEFDKWIKYNVLYQEGEWSRHTEHYSIPETVLGKSNLYSFILSYRVFENRRKIMELVLYRQKSTQIGVFEIQTIHISFSLIF